METRNGAQNHRSPQSEPHTPGSLQSVCHGEVSAKYKVKASIGGITTGGCRNHTSLTSDQHSPGISRETLTFPLLATNGSNHYLDGSGDHDLLSKESCPRPYAENGSPTLEQTGKQDGFRSQLSLSSRIHSWFRTRQKPQIQLPRRPSRRSTRQVSITETADLGMMRHSGEMQKGESATSSYRVPVPSDTVVSLAESMHIPKKRSTIASFLRLPFRCRSGMGIPIAATDPDGESVPPRPERPPPNLCPDISPSLMMNGANYQPSRMHTVTRKLSSPDTMTMLRRRDLFHRFGLSSLLGGDRDDTVSNHTTSDQNMPQHLISSLNLTNSAGKSGSEGRRHAQPTPFGSYSSSTPSILNQTVQMDAALPSNSNAFEVPRSSATRSGCFDHPFPQQPLIFQSAFDDSTDTSHGGNMTEMGTPNNESLIEVNLGDVPSLKNTPRRETTSMLSPPPLRIRNVDPETQLEHLPSMAMPTLQHINQPSELLRNLPIMQPRLPWSGTSEMSPRTEVAVGGESSSMEFPEDAAQHNVNGSTWKDNVDTASMYTEISIADSVFDEQQFAVTPEHQDLGTTNTTMQSLLELIREAGRSGSALFDRGAQYGSLRGLGDSRHASIQTHIPSRIPGSMRGTVYGGRPQPTLIPKPVRDERLIGGTMKYLVREREYRGHKGPLPTLSPANHENHITSDTMEFQTSVDRKASFLRNSTARIAESDRSMDVSPSLWMRGTTLVEDEHVTQNIWQDM